MGQLIERSYRTIQNLENRLTSKSKIARKEYPDEGQDQRESGQRIVGQLVLRVSRATEIRFFKKLVERDEDAPEG